MTGTFLPSRHVTHQKVGASSDTPPLFTFGIPTPIPQQAIFSAGLSSAKQPTETIQESAGRRKLVFDFKDLTPPGLFSTRSVSSVSNFTTATMSSDDEEQSQYTPKPPLQRRMKAAVSSRSLKPTVPAAQSGLFGKTPAEVEAQILKTHLSFLQTGSISRDEQEVTATPIFTHAVRKYVPGHFSQYGFFAGLSDILDQMEKMEKTSSLPPAPPPDPRLFFNIAAPSSAFICGSQGSGKSHTLSCLLENCLMKSNVSQLEHPLAGLVFHYDTFTSDERGTPCEAAYLASNADIQVRVLCSPTNFRTIQRTYKSLNVTVQPLEIDQSNLDTKRMLDLMAVSRDDSPMPLYLHEITRILKEMRLNQQETNEPFNYSTFKMAVEASQMTPAQKGPLTQRLDTLESFIPKWQTLPPSVYDKKIKKKRTGGNDWTIQPGQLTIVDLSCPCVTSEGACALFNMCLSLFLEQKTSIGRVVALDEAHKYMNTAPEAASLTATLLSSIRLQRHLGTRVFISTQEPTISPSLLDLCSITIVHRFSSPGWLVCLKEHIAALADEGKGGLGKGKVFEEIVKLRVGEALVFAPGAVIDVKDVVEGKEGVRGEKELVKLGVGFLRIKVRARITDDGGKSVMAN